MVQAGAEETPNVAVRLALAGKVMLADIEAAAKGIEAGLSCQVCKIF
jgi:hypothetical protein